MSSRGDSVSCFGGGDSVVAVLAVSVTDVPGERVAECVPAEVVGVGDDEGGESSEVALDGVEVTGVGRRRHELDPVGGREGADVGHPVGGEVVLDPLEALSAGVGEADLAHEREYVATRSLRAQPDAEPIAVNVVGAEDVAGAGAAGVVVPPAPPAPRRRPTRPRGAGPARRRPLAPAGPPP